MPCAQASEGGEIAVHFFCKTGGSFCVVRGPGCVGGRSVSYPVSFALEQTMLAADLAVLVQEMLGVCLVEWFS